MFTKRVHVFRAGSQTSAQGIQRNFSEKDLQQVVDNYDPSVHEAPLVIGHQGDSDSIPSYGWIKGFSRQGDNLYADVEFTDAAKELVKGGHYRKVSISFYSPDSVINPFKGEWSARHLALLGAAPPAVKGLEKFTFSEEEGVYDFAVTLTPENIFDQELGPTLIIEKSPLEMLKTKLDAVRKDVSSAVDELQETPNEQTTETPETTEATNEVEETSQKFAEGKRQPNNNAQQTADLEDNFPEELFMEDQKISRKHVKGAHGQVMQVVENVYDEAHKESKKLKTEEMDEMETMHGELPPALKKRAAQVKAQGHFSEDDDSMDHAEEEDFGRYDTARSSDNGYAGMMKVGKQDAAGDTGRFKMSKSSLQDQDRLNTAEDGEQEKDRKKTAKDSSDAAVGESRWSGQADAKQRVDNMDQYDVDAESYGVNAPKTASGNNPAGRVDAQAGMPTESEETPDDEVFAVSTVNVMSDGSMRVIRQTSDSPRKAVKGGAINHSEPEPAEVTSELGITTLDEGGAKGKMKKKQLSGEFDGSVAEIVGPNGAFAEMPKGEKKSTDKRMVPGAFDKIDEPDQTVGPDGAYAEDNLSGDFEGGPNQKTKKSGGVFAEEHGEKKKKPYTETGFGSTYDEDDSDGDDEDFNEMSVEHCGEGSMGQSKATGFPSQIYDELNSLKAKYAELERRHSEEKVKTRKEKIAGAVGHLYAEGKLTDGVVHEQELVAYCEGLEFGTLEFSEGESPATKLLSLLSKLPSMVSYGEVVQGGMFEYADEADLDPHSRALKLVEQSDGKLDYVEAIKRAMYS